jgi:hypothetical protein
VPVSDATRRRAQHLLEPGDTIHAIIPALPADCPSRYALIVLSHRAVTVLATGFWQPMLPKSVHSRHPRTRLGPADTTGTVPVVTLGPARYEIDEEYLPLLAAADRDSR